MSSFTSASQHYADYRDMPLVMDAQMAESRQVEEDMRNVLFGYEDLIDRANVPVYEARQVLPNACAVNLLWTVNARSLLNFFRQRLCRRNVQEMQIIAEKVFNEVNTYWPEYASLCGPYCYPSGKCNQGRMSCGNPYVKGEDNG